MADNKSFKIIPKQLGKANRNEPEWVNVMVFQPEFTPNDFKYSDGLYYHNDIKKVKNLVSVALQAAEKDNVNLLVFPELSIPSELVPFIANWSKCYSELIIVAGSHYYKDTNDDYPISRCPIIHNGKIYYSEKIYPAPDEMSSVKGWGIKGGSKILSFTESPIGKFLVLICSDNLVPDVREIIKEMKYDFLIVPATQNKSIYHWMELWADVNTGDESIYGVYANNKLKNFGDGKSSFWGRVTDKSKKHLEESTMTDFNPNGKLCEIKENNNFFSLRVDISNKNPINPTIVRKKEKLFNIMEVVQGNIENSNLDKWPISKNEYKHINEQIKKIEKNPENYLSFIYPEIIQLIENYLKKYNLVFITGPIHFGKTSMINLIDHLFKHKLSIIPTINGDSLSSKKQFLDKIDGFYYAWYTEIADYLLSKASKYRQNLNKEHRNRLENKDIYIDWLRTKIKVGEKYLQAFLRTIDDLKIHIGHTAKIIIGLKLDDIHKYVKETVFLSLKEDIFSLKLDPPVQLGVKLVIASRFLPFTSTNKDPVILLPHFNEFVVSNLVSLLDAEMGEDTTQRFIKLIIKYTDGYPWFVIRFLKIYIKLRIQGNRDEQINLSDKIFNNAGYWLTDKFINNKKPSTFLTELKNLIDTGDIKAKEIFKEFINAQPDPTILNNPWVSLNDFLIRQSGFFKINTESDLFENNGCILLHTHFKKIILENERSI